MAQHDLKFFLILFFFALLLKKVAAIGYVSSINSCFFWLICNKRRFQGIFQYRLLFQGIFQYLGNKQQGS